MMRTRTDGRCALREPAPPRESGFAAVVGVDPTSAITPLREHGASPMVTDLAELRFWSARAA